MFLHQDIENITVHNFGEEFSWKDEINNIALTKHKIAFIYNCHIQRIDPLTRFMPFKK